MKKTFKDDDNYVDYRPADYNTERGYNAITAANIHSSAVTSLTRNKVDVTGSNTVALGTVCRMHAKRNLCGLLVVGVTKAG